MRLAKLLRTFEDEGLLLLSDAKLPSVVALAAGEPVAGSWWGHPKGRAIYAMLQEFCAHEDVLAVKLVSGKVTFVHRRLWPAFLAVARAREPWQTQGLSRPARALLARGDAEGEVRASGAAVKELERRLLVHTEEIHTEGGAHAFVAKSWERWRRGRGWIGRSPPLERAKRELGQALERLNERHDAAGRLPFESPATRRPLH